MSGAVYDRTSNLGLGLIEFNFPNWGDDANENMKILDAGFSVVGVQLKGAWTNNTIYALGDLVVDVDLNSLWRCAVPHTSAASGTFEADRILHPTYWFDASQALHARGQYTPATTYYINDVVYQTASKYAWAMVSRNYTSTNWAADVASGALVIITDTTQVVTDANAAKTAAQSSATAAAGSATAAANSATAAATSATNSANSATASAGSATNAANSAATATTQATNASNSATNAAASATNAANSVVAANQYAADAFLSAQASAGSAQDAQDIYDSMYPDAVSDGNAYGRKNGAWVDVTEEVPTDGVSYARRNGAWIAAGGGVADVPDAQNYVRTLGSWVLGYTKTAIDTLLGGFVAKAGDIMTGVLTLKPPAAEPKIVLDKPALVGYANKIDSLVAGVRRWSLQMGNGADNAFTIYRFDSGGVVQTFPLVIDPATGIVAMPDGATTLTQPATDNDTSIATTAFVKSVTGAAPVVPFTVGIYSGDWNGLTTPGWHTQIIGPNNTNHPAPAAANVYFTCFVISTGVAHTQFAFPHAGGAASAIPYGCFYRGYSGSAWTAWQPIAIKTAEALNRIVNPTFQHSQENADTGSFTTGTYFADQWKLIFIMASAVPYGFRYPSIASPNGSKYRGIIYATVAQASVTGSDHMGIQQYIEGTRIEDWMWGTARAKQVVLRFGVRCGMVGTFGGAIRNAAVNRSFPFSFTISAAENDVDVYRTIVIPGDVTGTWNSGNSRALELWFTFAAGSTLTATPGVWAGTVAVAPTGITNGAAAPIQFHIFDVGLYADPDKTGLAPPFQTPDVAEELRACQRYWARFATVANTVTAINTVTLPSSMRLNPPAFSGGGAGFVVHASDQYAVSFAQTTQAVVVLTANARL